MGMGDKAHLFMCILLDIIQKSGYNLTFTVLQ